MGYIALQSMLIRLFVGKRTIHSRLVAPSPPLWINCRCNSASEAWFSSRAAASARSCDTPTYWSVESCCGSTGPMTLMLFDVHAVSSRLSWMEKTSTHASAFRPFFLKRALTPQERKGFGWFFCSDDTFQWAFFVHIKEHRIWIDLAFSSLWRYKKMKKMSRNTIWMRKADFVSYIIPSESEYGDVRSREMGLPSWARKPILIGTHLNFWPHFFSPCWTTSSSSPQNSHTLFFCANYISTELYMDPCFYILFFPHPQVLVLQGSELSRKFANVNVTQCVISRIFQNCGSLVSK